MFTNRLLPAALAVLFAGATAHAAGVDEKEPTTTYRLYSKPDPAAKGGITGRIGSPDLPIDQILAIPADEPRLVYEGTLGSDKRSFTFEGETVHAAQGDTVGEQ